MTSTPAQPDIPDDLKSPVDVKRDEVLPLDLRGAIDSMQFQLARIRETLDRMLEAMTREMV